MNKRELEMPRIYTLNGYVRRNMEVLEKQGYERKLLKKSDHTKYIASRHKDTEEVA